MRTDELMIGDWVQNTNGDKGKVIGFVFNSDNDIIISYNENVTYNNSSKIEPILLTDEILRNNNLIYFHESCGYDDWEVTITQCSTWYTIDISHTVDDGYDYSLDCFPIRYVHELQHLLRLHGLNKINIEI